VRHLQDQAGPVAGVRITAASAAMSEVDKNLDTLLQDVV
jgi:hypothetical protein